MKKIKSEKIKSEKIKPVKLTKEQIWEANQKENQRIIDLIIFQQCPKGGCNAY